MYVIPFADDPFIWDGTLFLHQGEPGRIHPYTLEKLKSLSRGKATTPIPS